MYSRIIDDMKWNRDGFSLLLTDQFGDVVTSLRTMDGDAIVGMLSSVRFARAFLHCRMATQGSTSLDNVHGWSLNGVYVQHNGILSDVRAKQLPVDSMLILLKIKELGINKTLVWLKSQSYANVFVIDSTTSTYYMSRTTVGSLFTDGQGNYSTNAIGGISQPVDWRSTRRHKIAAKSVPTAATLDEILRAYGIEDDTVIVECDDYNKDLAANFKQRRRRSS
jgi:hypothetical protein